MKRKSLLILLLSLIFFLTCIDRPSVTEHGIFAPARLGHVIGQDGVCSIDFNNEITFWTFADTILGTWKSDEKIRGTLLQDDAVFETMIPNSIAWSRKPNTGNIKNPELNFFKENGTVSPFIKNRKNEDPMKHRLWAVDGIRIGSRFYVYYLHIFVPDPGRLLEFETLYAGLARWDIPENWTPGDPVDFKRVAQLFSNNPPAFGAAVMERDGYIYIAGHYKGEGLNFPVKIARVKEKHIEDPDKYSFLKNDGSWTGRLEDSGSFLGDVAGECSLSWNRHLNKYVILYTRIFTNEIVMVQFDDFSSLPGAEKKTLYRIPAPASGNGMWQYSGKEIFSDGNRIYMIYINPDIYQPMLVEIKL